MKNTFIDVVKLLDAPTDTNPFYVVESKNGKHYVSPLGGRAAKGLQVGTELKLYRRESKLMSAYILERA
jgi:hypothetical protein